MRVSILFISGNVFFGLLITFCYLPIWSSAQPRSNFTITELQSPTDHLLIGLHLHNDRVYWASGAGSTIVRTIDGGQSWQKMRYESDTTLQFRDIHALDSSRAIVMAAGDGAKSGIFLVNFSKGIWHKAYTMPYGSGFLNSIAFWDNNRGLAFGDAVDGRLFLLITTDGGHSWSEIEAHRLPPAGQGEGGFASSGTNIALTADGLAFIGTGAGGNARLLISPDYGLTWESKSTPMVTGDAAGITSVRFISARRGLIAGGDLTITDSFSDNIFLTTDGGLNWSATSRPNFRGAIYGSAFTIISGIETLLITGPNGADLSIDGGKSWQSVSDKNLWSCDMLPSGTGILVGRGGRMLKIVVE